jgi:hypothetical protein
MRTHETRIAGSGAGRFRLVRRLVKGAKELKEGLSWRQQSLWEDARQNKTEHASSHMHATGNDATVMRCAMPP